jgi:hypothetical protein
VIKKITLALAISISSPSFSQSSPFDGGNFPALMDSYQAALNSQANESDRINGAMYLGFIAGVTASYTGKDFCVPSEVKLGALANITSEYVSRHPSIIGMHGHDIVFHALRHQYPCR